MYQSKDLAETQKRLWPGFFFFFFFFLSLGITIFKEFLKNNDGNIVPFESVALTLSSALEPRESVPNCKPVAGKRVLSSIYAASIHLAVARTECLINHLSSSGEKPLENPYRIPEFPFSSVAITLTHVDVTAITCTLFRKAKCAIFHL